MTHSELTMFFLALGVLLFFARLFGEIAKNLGQPAVLGEILAGILLGPTVLGYFLPGLFETLFPATEGFQAAMKGVTALAITLFLLIAGMEVDLSAMVRQGKSSATISVFGMVIPFGIGFVCAWFLPTVFGATNDSHRFLFAMFLGTVLAISALPVIAKTLMDLNIYRSDFGMVVISVAVVDDIAGWLLFAIILGMMDSGTSTSVGILGTIILTLGFAFLLLTIGRIIIDRLLPIIQAYTSWPGGVLGFAVVGAFLCGAFTEWIGIHSIFGAFLFGIALGDSQHLRERTRFILDHFISFIFAPLFFASIGLMVNFATNFDLLLVIAILVIACIGKLAGVGLAGRWVGFSWRESMAIGVGMNARGAMGIILAVPALQAGLINERVFVAIVVMALVTSMGAGTIMQKLLRHKRAPRFLHFLSSKAFVPNLKSRDSEGAIRELSHAVAPLTGLSEDAIHDLVWQREQLVATGIGNGIAIPHGRPEGLSAPVIAMGISRDGIDFDSPDGAPAQLIFLILTPRDNFQAQLDIVADIAKTFKIEGMTEKALATQSYIEFLGFIKSEEA
jgi:Kef-type K+ transport system membrane component KefB/mannitol/fructose-specific phosphotransferase system IIA component (Ntr-type)